MKIRVFLFLGENSCYYTNYYTKSLKKNPVVLMEIQLNGEIGGYMITPRILKFHKKITSFIDNY